MGRKVILNLAMSIDGYISDKDGGYDWIMGHNDLSQNTKKQFNLSDFTDGCDIIVMGRKAYEDNGINHIKDFEKKRFLVVTNQKRSNDGNVEFINEDIVEMVTRLKAEKGKNIWLYGGAQVAEAFIKADVIDEYIIGIIPVILGSGRKLFWNEYPTIKLHLDESTVTDGVAILRYTKPLS